MIDVVFTDTHFGWKNNSMVWLKYQLDFIYKQFIPTIKDLSKTDKVRVVHCGDVFESRSTISTYVADKVVKAFKDIRAICDEFIIVCGNHDFYSPNSDVVNTVQLFMNNLDIIIVDQKMYESEDNKAFVPWYVWESQSFTTNADTIFCHADIVLGKIPDCCKGKKIISGHIHTPLLKVSKCLYTIGSCYSLSFADSNSTRGFYILNGKDLKYIPNETSIKFYRLYDDMVLSFDIDSINSNDYIELYISETNMVKTEYINAIKKFTDKFIHLWIIPQIVEKTIDGEQFTGYNMEQIIEDIIPEELKEYYEKIKAKIKS